MIKFFRHIRKEQMDTGKTSKYLKCALGKIVLVVIGILIGSKFNNNYKSLPSLEGIKGWVTK